MFTPEMRSDKLKVENERLRIDAEHCDAAIGMLRMLCEHHYSYFGADADTSNDHSLYCKVKTARSELAAIEAARAALKEPQ